MHIYEKYGRGVLVVQVVVIVSSEISSCAAGVGLSACCIGEPEVGSEAARLLEGLTEHLVLLDVVIRHGPIKCKFNDTKSSIYNS